MAAIITGPDVKEKLSILSRDSQYDLACACGTGRDDSRRRSAENRWLYPASLPNGGTAVLFKTLISNVCVNDCGYCPIRADRDPRRCTLEPEDVVRAFLQYYVKGQAFGLFLSSGVAGSPDRAMDRINQVARLLRKTRGFRGYIHLKIIPGASDAAIEEAVSLSSAVSLNIETPGRQSFSRLSAGKDYHDDILRPIKLISRLTARGSRYGRVKQTTQFVVGASDESDREIVDCMGGLYRNLGLNRLYFSAYQRGLGRPELPGENSSLTNSELLTREHRLYQVDFLLRKYGFEAADIPMASDRNLSLLMDPKEHWALKHPEFFPVQINRADRYELLRVPGFGPVTVERVLRLREKGIRLQSIRDIDRQGKLLEKAKQYLVFG